MYGRPICRVVGTAIERPQAAYEPQDQPSNQIKSNPPDISPIPAAPHPVGCAAARPGCGGSGPQVSAPPPPSPLRGPQVGGAEGGGSTWAFKALLRKAVVMYTHTQLFWPPAGA